MIVPDAGSRTSKAALYADPNVRPPLLPPDPAGIPAELRTERRWVLWKLVRKNGRWTKLPVRPDGSPASSTDSATWTDFDTAWAAWQQNPRRFAGLMFALGDGWCGVDLDDARAADGTLLPWAAALLLVLAT